MSTSDWINRTATAGARGAFVVATVATAACAGTTGPTDGAGLGAAAEARAQGECTRPYAPSSPWNLRIPADAPYEARTASDEAGLGERLSSDPTQYTYPVYEVAPGTAQRRVSLSGWY